ncbi:tyrosine-type recombinase/integrase [Poseidonocella sp. HB161398]|uniref:tyrosine-type recombinase/integrase n=1 Tax=Poseidonocella sp. HB161398 TaxID=2320855 RepID=UPI001109E56C|nr:tyrosine-type recombinase/integrase [Poseidonocella sp. HB161398]
MRRDRMPRKRHLTWIKNRRGGLDPYHRVTWTENGKQKSRSIRLDWQEDLQRLDAEYWRVESGQHERQQPQAKRTWRELIIAWRKDPKPGKKRLSDATRRSYRVEMDLLMEKNGDKAVSAMTRRGLQRAHASMAATPRKADKLVQVVSLLWNYALRKLCWPLGPNPASGWDFYGVQRPFEPWPAWMVDKLDTAPQAVRTAARLILGKGERPSAAIATRWDDFSGEWMVVRDEKTDTEIEVFCPPSLADYLAAAPRSGIFVLAKNLTEPLGYDAVEKQFRTWRKSLGERAAPFSLHGLRKLAIVQLAEAGCSDAEIQAITNQSAEIVAYYRSRASRKIMSRNAQLRREQP